MFKKAVIFGLSAAAIILGFGLLGFEFMDEESNYKLWEILGYLGMIIGFSMIFLGIKTYRDNHLGGVIRFSTAFKMGLLITLVASVVYVAVWEVRLTNERDQFIDNYQASLMEKYKESGATEAEIAEKQQELTDFKELYKNPFFRFAITLLEIFPVGLIISLLSAALLRNKAPAKA